MKRNKLALKIKIEKEKPKYPVNEKSPFESPTYTAQRGEFGAKRVKLSKNKNPSLYTGESQSTAKAVLSKPVWVKKAMFDKKSGCHRHTVFDELFIYSCLEKLYKILYEESITFHGIKSGESTPFIISKDLGNFTSISEILEKSKALNHKTLQALILNFLKCNESLLDESCIKKAMSLVIFASLLNIGDIDTNVGNSGFVNCHESIVPVIVDVAPYYLSDDIEFRKKLWLSDVAVDRLLSEELTKEDIENVKMPLFIATIYQNLSRIYNTKNASKLNFIFHNILRQEFFNIVNNLPEIIKFGIGKINATCDKIKDDAKKSLRKIDTSYLEDAEDGTFLLKTKDSVKNNVESMVTHLNDKSDDISKDDQCFVSEEEAMNLQKNIGKVIDIDKNYRNDNITPLVVTQGLRKMNKCKFEESFRKSYKKQQPLKRLKRSESYKRQQPLKRLGRSESSYL